MAISTNKRKEVFILDEFFEIYLTALKKMDRVSKNLMPLFELIWNRLKT